MRAKSLLIGTVLALCGTAADAQWVVTDTLILSRVADASIYVCRADYTHKTDYQLIDVYKRQNFNCAIFIFFLLALVPLAKI